MMGRHDRDQEQLFYSFCLDEAVPADHHVRAIAAVRSERCAASEIGLFEELATGPTTLEGLAKRIAASIADGWNRCCRDGQSRTDRTRGDSLPKQRGSGSISRREGRS